jgi:acetyl-CoA C-acetyltransferase
MKDVVIVSGCRTAIGAFGGTLRDLNGALLASITMKEAVRRAGIDPVLIDDIRYGCCMESADTLNVTRVAALLAGIPDAVPRSPSTGCAFRAWRRSSPAWR